MAAPRFPLGRTSPRLVKKAKGGKNEISDIITEWTYTLRGSAVANVKTESTDKGYAQVNYGSLSWIRSPYKINLFPYCLGVWYIMRAMFVGFFSPSLALKTRVGSFFNISINNSHVHSGSLGMSAAMKMLKQKTKFFF